MIAEIFSFAMLAQTLRSSLPYVGAALGGTLSERSGVVNIALEGTLLSSALSAVAVAHATQSGWAGIVAGAACGLVIGFVHAALVEWGRVHAIISGVAINFVAAGGTRVVLRTLYASSSNSPAIHVSAVEAYALAFSILLSLAGTIALLGRTRFGLRLRAAGEAPGAAVQAGISVSWVRAGAVAIGGAICGLGGAALAFDQQQFQSGMSGGRGFIALVAVIVAGWRPGRAAVACIVFAFLDALQIVLQARAAALHDVLQMLPFVSTMIVLAFFGRRASRVPGGLGVHWKDA